MKVWNDSTFSDDMIGQGMISIMEFFENRAIKRFDTGVSTSIAR